MVELFWLYQWFPCGAVWSGSPWVEQSTVEGVEIGLVGDITIVVACDGIQCLVMVVISASQSPSSLLVLVLYLSSVNRGPDNCNKCDSEF